MRRAILGLATLLAFLAVPGLAFATTVTVHYDELDGGDYADDIPFQVVEVAAGAGEGNDILVVLEADGTTIRDDGARVEAPTSCERLTEHAVRCPPEELRSVSVTAGDRADRVAVVGETAETSVRGGGGDDVLTASPSAATLRGGPGRDLLRSAGGDDNLRGGAGADRLEAGGGDDLLAGDGEHASQRGDDAMDGGAGQDTASYEGYSRPLHIDLSRRRVTDRSGQRDSLRRIEGAEGGQRGDRIVGDRRSNVLEGFGGHDRLFGLSGDDHLSGEGCAEQPPEIHGDWADCHIPDTAAASDVLRAGPGDDLLEIAGPRSHAGTGDDVFAGTSDLEREALPRACEWWRDGPDDARDLSTHLTTDGRHLVVRARHGSFELTVRERDGRRRVLGRGAVAARPGTTATARLPLTASGRRIVAAARGPIRVRVVPDGTSSALLRVHPRRPG